MQHKQLVRYARQLDTHSDDFRAHARSAYLMAGGRLRTRPIRNATTAATRPSAAPINVRTCKRAATAGLSNGSMETWRRSAFQPSVSLRKTAVQCVVKLYSRPLPN